MEPAVPAASRVRQVVIWGLVYAACLALAIGLGLGLGVNRSGDAYNSGSALRDAPPLNDDVNYGLGGKSYHSGGEPVDGEELARCSTRTRAASSLTRAPPPVARQLRR